MSCSVTTCPNAAANKCYSSLRHFPFEPTKSKVDESHVCSKKPLELLKPPEPLEQQVMGPKPQQVMDPEEQRADPAASGAPPPANAPTTPPRGNSMGTQLSASDTATPAAMPQTRARASTARANAEPEANTSQKVMPTKAAKAQQQEDGDNPATPTTGDTVTTGQEAQTTASSTEAVATPLNSGTRPPSQQVTPAQEYRPSRAARLSGKMSTGPRRPRPDEQMGTPITPVSNASNAESSTPRTPHSDQEDESSYEAGSKWTAMPPLKRGVPSPRFSNEARPSKSFLPARAAIGVGHEQAVQARADRPPLTKPLKKRVCSQETPPAMREALQRASRKLGEMKDTNAPLSEVMVTDISSASIATTPRVATPPRDSDNEGRPGTAPKPTYAQVLAPMMGATRATSPTKGDAHEETEELDIVQQAMKMNPPHLHLMEPQHRVPDPIKSDALQTHAKPSTPVAVTTAISAPATATPSDGTSTVVTTHEESTKVTLQSMDTRVSIAPNAAPPPQVATSVPTGSNMDPPQQSQQRSAPQPQDRPVQPEEGRREPARDHKLRQVVDDLKKAGEDMTQLREEEARIQTKQAALRRRIAELGATFNQRAELIVEINADVLVIQQKRLNIQQADQDVPHRQTKSVREIQLLEKEEKAKTLAQCEEIKSEIKSILDLAKGPGASETTIPPTGTDFDQDVRITRVVDSRASSHGRERTSGSSTHHERTSSRRSRSPARRRERSPHRGDSRSRGYERERSSHRSRRRSEDTEDESPQKEATPPYTGANIIEPLYPELPPGKPNWHLDVTPGALVGSTTEPADLAKHMKTVPMELEGEAVLRHGKAVFARKKAMEARWARDPSPRPERSLTKPLPDLSGLPTDHEVVKRLLVSGTKWLQEKEQARREYLENVKALEEEADVVLRRIATHSAVGSPSDRDKLEVVDKKMAVVLSDYRHECFKMDHHHESSVRSALKKANIKY